MVSVGHMSPESKRKIRNDIIGGYALSKPILQMVDYVSVQSIGIVN